MSKQFITQLSALRGRAFISVYEGSSDAMRYYDMLLDLNRYRPLFAGRGFRATEETPIMVTKLETREDFGLSQDEVGELPEMSLSYRKNPSLVVDKDYLRHMLFSEKVINLTIPPYLSNFREAIQMALKGAENCQIFIYNPSILPPVGATQDMAWIGYSVKYGLVNPPLLFEALGLHVRPPPSHMILYTKEFDTSPRARSRSRSPDRRRSRSPR